MQTPINSQRSSCWAFGAVLLCLLAIYSAPLLRLLACAATRDLYSHIFLVPFISLYLAFTKRAEMHGSDVRPSRAGALVFAAAGLLALLAYAALVRTGQDLHPDDALSLIMLSFVLFLIGAFLLCFGRQLFRILSFPLLFLLFLVPMPTLMVDAFERVLQHGSAACYAGLLTLTRTPFFRDGTFFRVPGLSLEVATECSGIRSTLVLFITSLLAGHMFLQTGWRKAVMAASFLPIALLRNAARILTITLGTMYIDPTIIDGPVHHRGGGPFFVLSLVPLFLILILLKKTERTIR